MTMGMDGTWISIMYLIFGVAAIIGGGVGGMLSDRYGTKPTIVAVIIVFAISIFTIPYTTSVLPLFLLVMVIWSMLSWAITPAIQSYLIETAPETSDIQQSLNNSALHFGIAFGSMIGGIVIEQSSVEMNATVGGVFVLFSLGVVLMSMMRRKNKAVSTTAA
jgi:MFS transporter, DHA1 family, purine base/nucleoside efflux pump